MNDQVCRFACEAVFARDPGREATVARFAGISPIYDAVTLNVAKGALTHHRLVFGPHPRKPKWRDEQP